MKEKRGRKVIGIILAVLMVVLMLVFTLLPYLVH